MLFLSVEAFHHVRPSISCFLLLAALKNAYMFSPSPPMWLPQRRIERERRWKKSRSLHPCDRRRDGHILVIDCGGLCGERDPRSILLENLSSYMGHVRAGHFWD